MAVAIINPPPARPPEGWYRIAPSNGGPPSKWFSGRMLRDRIKAHVATTGDSCLRVTRDDGEDCPFEFVSVEYRTSATPPLVDFSLHFPIRLKPRQATRPKD